MPGYDERLTSGTTTTPVDPSTLATPSDPRAGLRGVSYEEGQSRLSPSAGATTSLAPTADEIALVREWVRAGDAGDASTITDRLFYTRHPELAGKKLSADSVQVAEWKLIRDRGVKPVLAEQATATTTSTTSAPTTAAPASTTAEGGSSLIDAVKPSGMLETGLAIASPLGYAGYKAARYLWGKVGGESESAAPESATSAAPESATSPAPETSGSEAAPAATPGERVDRLPDEEVAAWVELARRADLGGGAAASAETDRRYYERHPGPDEKLTKNSPPERIDEWKTLYGEVCAELNAEPYTKLPELRAAIERTSDPAQKRALSGALFIIESTKNGTRYAAQTPGSDGMTAEFDIGGTFVCDQAVQWMMTQAGLGDVLGQVGGVGNMGAVVMSTYGCAELRQTPKLGDIMFWGGHVGMVVSVDAARDAFLAAHMGCSGSQTTQFHISDPHKASYTGAKSDWFYDAKNWGNGQVLGFWSPEEAKLPDPVGTATVSAKGATCGYFAGETWLAGRTSIAGGTSVEVLRVDGKKALVRPVGSPGVSWVDTSRLEGLVE